MSESRLRRVGAAWKPRPGMKSLGSGEVTVNGLRQRFLIVANDHKQKPSQPDYVLLSSDDPEPDDYERDRQRGAAHARPASEDQDDDIPF